MSKREKSDEASDERPKLSGKEYEEALRKLHIELVKLQELGETRRLEDLYPF